MRLKLVDTCRGKLIAPNYAGGLRFSDKPGGGWRIDQGIGRFLVAEGSGWSRPVGRSLFRELQRNAIRRPHHPEREG